MMPMVTEGSAANFTRIQQYTPIDTIKLQKSVTPVVICNSDIHVYENKYGASSRGIAVKKTFGSFCSGFLRYRDLPFRPFSFLLNSRSRTTVYFIAIINMAWQPDEAAVGEVLAILQNSQTPDTTVQAQVQAQLHQYQAVPEFNQTLSFIFITMRDQPLYTRTAAGLLLKNNIRRSLETMPAELIEALMVQMLQGLGDSERQVRRTIGTCISTLATKMGNDHGWLEHWPALMPALAACLDSGEPAAIDGSLDTLLKICEDVPDRMVSDTSEPLNVILPKLFNFFTSEEPAFRENALAIMNQFILLDPPILSGNMETFLQGLFHLTSDANGGVRKRVCQGINQLIEVNFDTVLPHINGVIEFMLHSMQSDTDNAVVLGALEFWQYIAEAGSSQESRQAALAAIQPYLPRLVPALLEGMVYEVDDPAMEFAEDVSDDHVPDRPQDIAPIHRRGGGADEWDEEDDDDDDDGGDTSWNRRKGSASALDLMAMTFRNELLPELLPLVQQLLQADDWLRRESGILAIGAIANGCYEEMAGNMGEILPFLMVTIDDAAPLIRSMSCWTVSRYGRWIVDCSTRIGQPEVLANVIEKILGRCLDGNKRVQEAAISALAVIEESARQEVTPYLEPIIQTLVACFGRYQAKNFLILLDAVATLAEGVGAVLAQPEVVALLMPPLMARWEATADDDKAMIPLQECLSALSYALKVAFLPFFEPLFGRAVNCVTQRMEAITAGGASEVPDFEFATVSLDLISSLADNIPAEQLGPVVASTNFIALLGHGPLGASKLRVSVSHSIGFVWRVCIGAPGA
jgi:transportin-1